MKKSDMTNDEMKSLIRKIIIRFLLLPVFIGMITLLPAGTFNYWQAYLYTAVLLVPMICVLIYFIKNDPKFLERRTRSQEKEKAQKIIQIFFTLVFLSGFIVSGLDRRFGWSDVPISIVILSDVVILLGYLLVFFVFKQNSYASRIVETEKNQELISTGLYSFVRHPMYVGVLIMYVLSPLALGSYWGLLPMSTMPVALILRIINEESVLLRELPGYKEYCKKTRYRLIPFVW